VQRVTKYESDVLVELSASDEARGGVQYGLQTPSSIRRSAVVVMPTMTRGAANNTQSSNPE